jgi:Xaa-Pro aminopeptidase
VNIPFTIEPGLYFKNRFGVRSEIDCYVTENYKLIITTKVQKRIIRI